MGVRGAGEEGGNQWAEEGAKGRYIVWRKAEKKKERERRGLQATKR